MTRELDIAKYVAKEMLNEFHISPDNTRAGIIQYGRDPRMVVSLDSNSDKRMLNHFIYRLTNLADGNRIDKALDFARTNLYYERFGTRKGVPKTLVVFTNKEADVDPQVAARKLKDLGIKIIVIGVGPQVNESQLKGMTASDREVFVAKTAEDAKKITAGIRKGTMPGMFI